MSGPDVTMMPPPPPPTPPAPSTWMPPGMTSAPTPPLSQRLSPEAMGAKIPWQFLAFIAQSVGLLLIFVGGLIAVTAGVFPPNCYNASPACGAGTAENIAYGIMSARLLIVLGLFGLAAGAGLHLQFRPMLTAGATPEQTRTYLARRRGEFGLLVLTVLLVILIVYWSVQVPPL
jgi:hypothetical protein